MGWLPAALAPLALWSSRRRAAVFFAGLAALAMALATGGPLYRLHYALFPMFRIPGRLLGFWAIGVTVLGVIALILQRKHPLDMAFQSPGLEQRCREPPELAELRHKLAHVEAIRRLGIGAAIAFRDLGILRHEDRARHAPNRAVGCAPSRGSRTSAGRRRSWPRSRPAR